MQIYSVSLKTRMMFLAVFCHVFALSFCPASEAQLGGGGGSNLFYNPSLSGVDSSNSNNPTNAMNALTRPSFALGSESGPSDPYANWQPATFPLFPVRYLNLPNFNQSEKDILSQNYFVVINDSNIKSFAQLYNENRLGNISSFVTADSIMHPFFAFQNNVKLKVIERTLVPLLESLLITMIRNTENDYKVADDAETKEEIKYNWAFLTVALKLLTPDFPLPSNPGVRKLVEDELTNIKLGKSAQSAIFHRMDNFSGYSPTVFYKATDSAKHFYSSYQWLSKNYLELSDITSDTTTGNGNEFRRAFLLFQSLMKVQLEAANTAQKARSGMQIWKQINKILADLGLDSANRTIDQGNCLLPDNFARAMASTNASITIASLSDPLNRTRLLLTIRGYGPRQFGSTSIFSLGKKDANRERQLTFHLLNPLYDPLQEILLPEPVFQKDENTTFSLMPIALLLLQNNGVRWASKMLAKNASKIDEQIINQLTERQNALLSIDTNLDSLRPFWKRYTSFANPYPEQLPLYGQTADWRTFCLERQTAAWADSLLATNLKPAEPKIPDPKNLDPKNAQPGAPNNPSPTNNEIKTGDASTISNIIKKYNLGSWRTNNNFNYLEPTFNLYTQWTQSELDLENSLNQTGIFPSEYLQQSHDFIRLLKRLTAIAKLELNMDLPKADDQALLATIDNVLKVIEPPLPAKLYMPFPVTASVSLKTNNQSGTTLPGVNIELSYPATVFLIVQYRHCYYLLRGATYSYAEQCGEEINDKHWQRRVEFGFIETPFWCQSFQRSHSASN